MSPFYIVVTDFAGCEYCDGSKSPLTTRIEVANGVPWGHQNLSVQFPDHEFPAFLARLLREPSGTAGRFQWEREA